MILHAEEAVVSFSNKTGTLTIKAGEINPNDIKHFAKDKKVKHVVCERGAILPANCNGLFRDYMAKDIDLSKADGSKVKKMNYMFSCCQNLKTLDISSLYGGTDQMEMMFKYCSSFTTIYVSDRWEGVLGTYDVIWNPDWEGVFRGCTSLKGGNGTAYSENGDHYYYAVIDRSDRPGYMTEVKPKVLAKGVKTDQSEATLKAEKMEQTVFIAYITNDDVSVDSIKWSSSDPTIASVDEQGTVTAIQKGKVTITATATNGTADTSDDKAASCTVTVTSDGSVGTARFDESTGILTLGGNVTMEQIQIHRENVNVKQVVADKGTVLPEDCSIMFSRFGATYGEEQDGDWDQEGPFWKGLEYVDLSRADSSKVKYMEAMFAQCYKLKVIDLSGLDTSNVTSMYYMFYDCNPYAILVSDKWDMTKAINKNSDGGMFYGCIDLIGGNGTKYDSDHIDGEYARIDKKGQPGYFIDKAAVKPAKSLKLDKTEIELIIGSKEEEEITVSSSPKDTTSRSVKWTSSDNNIAYYSDRYGKIIAKSEGTAIITVFCDNCTPNPADDVKAECTVTVKMPDTPSASLDRKTGILTLKGNVSKNDLEAYKEIKGIKKIVAEKGAVLPEDCSNLIAGETDIYYNDYW